MIRIEDTLKLLKEHQPDADEMLVRRAYIFSARVHQGQLRKSGEPYLIHPVEVSYIVASLGLDAPSVAAALLHDTVEDTVTTIEEIEETFGKDVAFLVESLTKIAKLNFKSAEEAQAENYRRLLVAMVQDLRVILVKLADRLHNMRTMQYMPPEKQQRISQETLDIYAPLANRLGIAWIKTELEDLCFKYLYPEEYHDLAAQIAKTRAERESYIARVVEQLKTTLEKQGVTADVTGRPKHLWSIYQKMQLSHHSLNSLYDIQAFRIIVDSVEKCYGALGYIHSMWKPIPNRFKDYIALPKENGYQSLHTSVIGPENERIELQIRTKQMHDVACYGVAAHWNYKESQYGRDCSPQFRLLQNVSELGELKGKDFIDAVKIDLFHNTVFVFTPQGEVLGFPKGSTVLDFAYAIHTDLGHECTGARINGVQVPLRTELELGQYVDILRTPGSKPKPDWLKFVVTSRAKAKIRAYLRQEDNARSEQLGIEKLDRELKRYGLNLNKMRKSGQLEECSRKGKFKSPRELFLAIGYEKVRLESILDLFLPEDVKREQAEAAQQETEIERLKKVAELAKPVASTGGRTGVIVDGLEGIACHFPRCCSPVHGDPILGFVSAGQCVTIHRADCPQVANYDNGRQVEVRWEKDGQTHQSQVRVRVLGKDAPGLLASMSQALYDAGVNISGVSCRTTPERDTINIFTLLISDIDQLTRAMKLLKRIDGISTVERLNN